MREKFPYIVTINIKGFNLSPPKGIINNTSEEEIETRKNLVLLVEECSGKIFPTHGKCCLKVRFSDKDNARDYFGRLFDYLPEDRKNKICFQDGYEIDNHFKRKNN